MGLHDNLLVIFFYPKKWFCRWLILLEIHFWSNKKSFLFGLIHTFLGESLVIAKIYLTILKVWNLLKYVRRMLSFDLLMEIESLAFCVIGWCLKQTMTINIRKFRVGLEWHPHSQGRIQSLGEGGVCLNHDLFWYIFDILVFQKKGVWPSSTPPPNLFIWINNLICQLSHVQH